MVATKIKASVDRVCEMFILLKMNYQSFPQAPEPMIDATKSFRAL
jgi:hypothetical protein